MAVTRREFLASGAMTATAAIGAVSNGRWPDEGAPFAGGNRADSGDGEAQPLGIAVIGLGNFAQYVLPRLARSRRVRVTALVSGDDEKSRRLAAEHGVDAGRVLDYAALDRLRDDPSVGAVYVAVPVGLHAEYAIRALRMGKHVLTEKTMAASVPQAREMIAAADAAGRVLMVAYRARHDPFTQEAIRLARSRELGDLVSVTTEKGFPIGDAFGKGRWRLDPALAGGGSLVDIGIYSVQAARYLTGEEPAEVTATARWSGAATAPATIDDDIAWTLRFPSGVLATGTASWRYALQNRYRAVFTNGWLDLEPATSNGNLRMRVGRGPRGAVVEERLLAPVDQIPLMFDHFADCVTANRAPITPGAEGVRDLEVIAALYDSARAGRVVRLGG